MTASGNDKILRIGVIQGGKVIEERLIRKRTTVTFGSDHKSTFVFGGKEFPKSWPLFELKGSQYQLVFSDAMDGRVSVDNANVDFGSLKAQNLAQKQGADRRDTGSVDVIGIAAAEDRVEVSLQSEDSLERGCPHPRRRRSRKRRRKTRKAAVRKPPLQRLSSGGRRTRKTASATAPVNTAKPWR